MILLDTHIWVWWINQSKKVTTELHEIIQANEDAGLGVSAISCWEVAKLVELGRLELAHPIAEWIEEALAYPGMQLLELTPRVAVESTQLPGEFHRDPADQIIVATARIYGIPLLTIDSRISSYSHVMTLPATDK